MGFWTEESWNWSLPWVRPFRPKDNDEWFALDLLLQKVVLNPKAEDKMIWAPQKSEIFSVNSFYSELAKQSLPSIASVQRKIWSGLVPRIEIFLWLACQDKLNTKNKLARLHIIPAIEDVCTLCNLSPESCSHLFLHCHLSWLIWTWWCELWSLNWTCPSSIKEALEQWHIPSKSEVSKKLWLTSFMVIIWSIWKEWNDRTFNKKSSSLTDIQDLILLRLTWWIKAWDNSFPYSPEEVRRNPLCLKLHGRLPIQKPLPAPSLWTPPCTSHLKWNVDASYNPSLGRSAIGGVLRDKNGAFKCLFSCPIPPMEINSAEVLAIHRAIQISLNNMTYKSQEIEIESDSSNAVQWCTKPSGGPWNLSFILNFIRSAPSRGLKLSIHHQRRNSNFVADSLAKQGLHRGSDFVAWL